MSLTLYELAAAQTYLFVFIQYCENKQSEQIMMQQLLFFILVTKLFTLDISTTDCKSHFYHHICNYTESLSRDLYFCQTFSNKLLTAELVHCSSVEYKDPK